MRVCRIYLCLTENTYASLRAVCIMHRCKHFGAQANLGRARLLLLDLADSIIDLRSKDIASSLMPNKQNLKKHGKQMLKKHATYGSEIRSFKL
jgi:hypothetical protein